MASVRDLAEALGRWTPGDRPATTWFLPELRSQVNAAFAGAYRPKATAAGWSLDFMHGAGDGAETNVATFRRHVASLPASETFHLNNPHLVRREERNRVRTVSQLLRRFDEASEVRELVFRRLGIAGHDQLRVLVCDGPRQLAWVGATRQEAFTARETKILRRLVGPLRDRLQLEQRVCAPSGVAYALLETALEQIPAAAFVVGPRLEVELANRAGVRALERDRKRVIEAIRASARGHVAAGGFSITRVVSPGWPPYLLAVQEQADRIMHAVYRAQDAWGLSTRQARVLELLATGATNKEIASALDCAEATVETHVSELFRRSRTTSRAGLVGKLIAIG